MQHKFCSKPGFCFSATKQARSSKLAKTVGQFYVTLTLQTSIWLAYLVFFFPLFSVFSCFHTICCETYTFTTDGYWTPICVHCLHVCIHVLFINSLSPHFNLLSLTAICAVPRWSPPMTLGSLPKTRHVAKLIMMIDFNKAFAARSDKRGTKSLGRSRDNKNNK